MSSEWRGVMVEPVPYVFERLRSNYAGIDRIRTENVAIADHDGTQRLYYLPEASDDQLLPDWYDELASFKKDVVLQHSTEIPDIESRIESIDVPCLTFDSLCRKHSIAQLDVIHIDTEGYDWEIIRSVDLARLQPTLLIFEHYHLDPDLYGRCIEHLRSHAYEELAVGMNTVCVRPAGLSWRDRRFRDEWRSARAHPHLVFRADVDRRPRDGAQHSADR